MCTLLPVAGFVQQKRSHARRSRQPTPCCRFRITLEPLRRGPRVKIDLLRSAQSRGAMSSRGTLWLISIQCFTPLFDIRFSLSDFTLVRTVRHLRLVCRVCGDVHVASGEVERRDGTRDTLGSRHAEHVVCDVENIDFALRGGNQNSAHRAITTVTERAHQSLSAENSVCPPPAHPRNILVVVRATPPQTQHRNSYRRRKTKPSRTTRGCTGHRRARCTETGRCSAVQAFWCTSDGPHLLAVCHTYPCTPAVALVPPPWCLPTDRPTSFAPYREQPGGTTLPIPIREHPMLLPSSQRHLAFSHPTLRRPCLTPCRRRAYAAATPFAQARGPAPSESERRRSACHPLRQASGQASTCRRSRPSRAPPSPRWPASGA